MKQWRDGDDPKRPVIQRIAGTLVEIAIDYAKSDPTLFGGNGRGERVARAFLLSLDDVDFAEAKFDDLLIEVFRAGLRTLEEQGDLVNAEISAAQPIAIWVNYQQLRIAQNAIDVWSAVARPEDRRQPPCRWSMRGEQVWKDRCRAAYDMKEPVDTLHEKLHGARSQLTCGPPT